VSFGLFLSLRSEEIIRCIVLKIAGEFEPSELFRPLVDFKGKLEP
jgi:hypothetical protein